MDIFSNILFYLIFLSVVSSLWSLYDRYWFTRFEGDLKRGLIIWAKPLSWETRQFLDSLPSSLKVERSFIRKEYNEVLIVEKLSFLKSFFSRRNYLTYVAYVNLSAPEGQIEFRASFAALALLTINLIMFFVLLTGFFFAGFPIPTLIFWIFAAFFLALFTGSLIWEHYQARRRLLNFLAQMMSQQRSGLNIGF